MKRYCLAALLVVLSAEPCLAQQPTVDVEHYTFRLTLSDATDEIQGEASVTLRWMEAGLASFWLDLISRRGLSSKGMEVESVTRDGRPIQHSHNNDRLTIEDAPASTVGERRTYTIRYRGEPADGLVIATNIYGDRTFFGDNWPNRARNWLPTVDHPSDKASVEFIVTAPAQYQVISSGLLAEETDLQDGTRLTHWRTDVPLPTKVIVIGVARFAVQHADEYDSEYEDIPIQNWLYPQNRELGFRKFEVTEPIMRYFETNIGPYPYEKIANVQSKTRYGGMENASNIFYSENAIASPNSNESLIAHEIAHQWFGNSVSEADWQYIWLSEGFATYFTQLYIEATYGDKPFRENMRRSRNAILQFYRTAPDAPLVNPDIDDPNQHLNANSYSKGAWVLHMLRNRIGNEAFWTGIRSYYATYRDRNATSADLQQEMENASGEDLNAFFQQWLYRPGHPLVEGSWSLDATGQTVAISLRQTQSGPAFSFVLNLGLVGPEGSMTHETIQVNSKTITTSIESDHPVSDIVLDPEVNLLFDLVSWGNE